MVVQTTLWFAAMGAILFLAAGDWRWLQGWVFLGELGFFSFAVSLWLLRYDPALLESRLSAPVRRDQMPWDRIFMLAVAVLHRLDGADRPRRAPLRVVARAALGAGAGRRADRARHGLGLADLPLQHLRSSPGPRAGCARAPSGYGRAVSHCAPPHVCRWHALAPRHAAAARLLVGGVAVPLLVTGMALRAVGEERMLRRELSCYDEYARRVRFRLLPGIW
jgi:hypothetical protein